MDSPDMAGTRSSENIINREAVEARVHDARERMNNLVERGRERAMELENNLEHYVQDQPVKSILIAAGVGLLLGAILARR
jgi:ElaB/YqjD/DUF883 family membrane-anchored ribosome-binding protein